jgi:transcriptional regulator with GAF, ATPase, and Fis domain
MLRDVIAITPRFAAVVADLEKFATYDATILLTGETGTGKSYLAGAVHSVSGRKNQRFVTVNCANFQDTLLESELFGHEQGAFTGADKKRVGRFEWADGGTVFLDEIGEIPMKLQAKLLRVIESHSFERVGGNKTVSVDVRIIAATNKDLSAQVAAGKFREDLYYRINVLPVHLPPLRERQLCLIPLAEHLLSGLADKMGKEITGFAPDAVNKLLTYPWPGNIRQLSHTLERAVILEDGGHIHASTLYLPAPSQPALSASSAEGLAEEIGPSPAPGNHLQQQERTTILAALQSTEYRQKDAAELLGVSPRALNYKIKRYGIKHKNWRVNRLNGSSRRVEVTQ